MKDSERKVNDPRRDDARGNVDESRASNRAPDARDDTDRTAEVVGEATGGLAGVATGAAIGSLGGPIGTIIGGIAGAVGGWWAGHAIAESAGTYTDEDDRYYRDVYESRRAGGALRGDAAEASAEASDFDRHRPAYQLGQIASRNPEYDQRSFDEVEGDLRRGWTDDVRSRYGDWSEARDFARAGFERGREARLTLSEEQLAVGRREVSAGEATIRKTVETEHVSQRVPVQREEIVVERRAVAADAPSDAQIGEDEIRIPLVREEVVVEKRAVPVEEVVVRKEVVTEEQPVEADLRRERVDERSLRAATDRPAELPVDRPADRPSNPADRADDDLGDKVHRGARKVGEKLADLKEGVSPPEERRPAP